MPGLVGHVAVAPATADLTRALQRLSHFASYRSASYAHSAAVQVGRVVRAGRDPAAGTALSADGTVAVHLAGHARRAAAPFGDVTAADLLAAYLGGRFNPDAADGGFVCCVVDLNRRRLLLCNDRLGALPVVYAATGHGFAFAPEAKALFPTLGLAPRLEDRGVVDFLTAGYCLGEHTLFEGVRCLEPGTLLTLDLATLAVHRERYWRLTHRPSPALAGRRDAAQRLYETLEQSQASLLGAPGTPFDILLSGGLDSRCLLALAVRTGRIPTRTFGWGVRVDIPYTDPFIAAQLARRFDVRFDFLRVDTEQFIDNALDWSYLSELTTDNLSWYGEGTRLLASSYDPSVHFTLNGDEGWGDGGQPRSRAEAIDSSVPAVVSTTVLRLARPQAREFLASTYAASVEAAVAAWPNEDLTDLRDYTYLHARSPRFLFALSYYRELATEIRRPFLTRAVLELMQGLPAHFRHRKNLYRSMLLKYFPELRRFPINLANGLPDWKHALTAEPAPKALFTELLSERRLESSVLSRWLDPAAVAAAWAAYSAVPAPPLRRRVGTLAVLRHRLVPESLKIRRSATGRIRDGVPARTEFDSLRAFALLSLFEGQLARLAP